METCWLETEHSTWGGRQRLVSNGLSGHLIEAVSIVSSIAIQRQPIEIPRLPTLLDLARLIRHKRNTWYRQGLILCQAIAGTDPDRPAPMDGHCHNARSAPRIFPRKELRTNMAQSLFHHARVELSASCDDHVKPWIGTPYCLSP